MTILVFELERVLYAEGLLQRSELPPLEHGWCILDEEIIDPTLPEAEGVYIPLVTFSYQDIVLNAVEKEWGFPFYEQDRALRETYMQRYYQAMKEALNL